MLCVIAGTMHVQGILAENTNKSKAIAPRALFPKFEGQIKSAPGTPGQWWAGSPTNLSGKKKSSRGPADDKIFQLERLLEKSQETKRKPAQLDPSTLSYHRRMLRLFQNGRDSAEYAKEDGLFKGVCVKAQAPNGIIPSVLAVFDQGGKRYFIPLLGAAFEATGSQIGEKLTKVIQGNPLGLYRLLVKEQPLFTPVAKHIPPGLGLGMLLQREFEESMIFLRGQRLFRVRQSFESGKTAYIIQETCNEQEGCYLADEENPELLFAHPIMHCYYDEEISLKIVE